ncbi:MAG: DNA polymerase III subunit delta' [Proteobacteria bacterium]|nr:DNA polymerase III subunit delta' [Pseudomonadota bacterium]
MSKPIHPWLAGTWERLCAYRHGERMPHAMLLTGPAGLGKLGMARAFLQLLLCSQPSQSAACGECSNCRQALAGSHPDLHEITFEEDDKGKLRKQIVVDQVRRLAAKFSMTSGQGGWKVALVHPADAMNVNAANSLLKTLEEPAPRSLLLLVSSRPANLPATIRSRCQHVAIPRPDSATGLAWLKAQDVPMPDAALAYAGNVPLRALELAGSGFIKQRGDLLQRIAAVQSRGASAVTVAGEFEALPAADVIDFLDAVCEDLVRLRQLGTGAGHLRNPDLLAALKTLAERVDLSTLHRYREVVRDARRLTDTSVNPRLLLESLLLPWASGMSAATNERILDRLLED